MTDFDPLDPTAPNMPESDDEPEPAMETDGTAGDRPAAPAPHDGVPSLAPGDIILDHGRPARIMQLETVDYARSDYHFRVDADEYVHADGRHVAAMLARGHWERLDVDASPFLIDPGLPAAGTERETETETGADAGGTDLDRYPAPGDTFGP